MENLSKLLNRSDTHSCLHIYSYGEGAGRIQYQGKWFREIYFNNDPVSEMPTFEEAINKIAITAFKGASTWHKIINWLKNWRNNG